MRRHSPSNSCWKKRLPPLQCQPAHRTGNVQARRRRRPQLHLPQWELPHQASDEARQMWRPLSLQPLPPQPHPLLHPRPHHLPPRTRTRPTARGQEMARRGVPRGQAAARMGVGKGSPCRRAARAPPPLLRRPQAHMPHRCLRPPSPLLLHQCQAQCQATRTTGGSRLGSVVTAARRDRGSKHR